MARKIVSVLIQKILFKEKYLSFEQFLFVKLAELIFSKSSVTKFSVKNRNLNSTKKGFNLRESILILSFMAISL